MKNAKKNLQGRRKKERKISLEEREKRRLTSRCQIKQNKGRQKGRGPYVSFEGGGINCEKNDRAKGGIG